MQSADLGGRGSRSFDLVWRRSAPPASPDSTRSWPSSIDSFRSTQPGDHRRDGLTASATARRPAALNFSDLFAYALAKGRVHSAPVCHRTSRGQKFSITRRSGATERTASPSRCRHQVERSHPAYPDPYRRPARREYRGRPTAARRRHHPWSPPSPAPRRRVGPPCASSLAWASASPSGPSAPPVARHAVAPLVQLAEFGLRLSHCPERRAAVQFRACARSSG